MEQINFSYALPVKFYKATATPGGHFDDDWAYNRIKAFEIKTRYPQRWQVGDSTPLQVTSTILPEPLKVLNCKGVEVASIDWTEVLGGSPLKVYQLTLNLDAAYAASPVYKVFFLYQQAIFGSADLPAISEPIEVRVFWPNTNVFAYTNSFNAFNIVYTDRNTPSFVGPVFRFRIESGITDYKPDAESADFIDEIHDVELLSATPFDTFKLTIGTWSGVGEIYLKLLNFIIHHNIWKYEIKNNDALQYVRSPGAKWDVNRIRPYTLVGASIDILPATNKTALQLIHDGPLDGIVTAYDLETDFFGPGATVPIEEYFG